MRAMILLTSPVRYEKSHVHCWKSLTHLKKDAEFGIFILSMCMFVCVHGRVDVCYDSAHEPRTIWK